MLEVEMTMLKCQIRLPVIGESLCHAQMFTLPKFFFYCVLYF